MLKLSDTQSILLSAAANREDGSLLPPPDGLKTRGAALDRTLKSLLRRGLIATTPTAAAKGDFVSITFNFEGQGALTTETVEA